MKKEDSRLKALKRKIELWRKEKQHQRAAMPKHLWREAVDLCEVYSACRIRRELRLEHSKLKTLLGMREKQESSGEFVSIDLPNRTSVNPVFEWVRPDGAKLRVRVPAGDLDQLVSSFFGGQL